MQPSDLLVVVNRLDPGGPIYLRLTDDLRGGQGKTRPWYTTQKQHLQGWLREYQGPGAYGRANWTNRSAEFVYNHFQCVEGLAWLAEAVGVPIKTLNAACDEVRNAKNQSATRCGVFRRAIPWVLIEEQIALLPKLDNQIRGCRAEQAKANKPKPFGGYGHAAMARR